MEGLRSVKASVIRPGELAPAELTRWRAMQQASPHLDSPFLAPGYALAVDQVRNDVRVAVLEEDGTVVGFFCFQLRGRRARPLAGGLSDCEGIVHTPGWRWSPGVLLRSCGLTSWDFHTLIEEQVPDGIGGISRSSTPVIDVAQGYQAYLEYRRRSSRRSIQTTLRKQRKMEREVGKLHFEFTDRDPTALQALMDWKSIQYRQMDEWDRFAVPWITSLVRNLFDTMDTGYGCSGTLSMLYVADRPAAGYFGLRSSSTLACWFPSYNPELAQYSPGILLHLLMAEAAAGHGVGVLNLGAGHEGYKDSLKTSDLVVARGAVDNGSPRALAVRVTRAPRRYLGPWIKGHPRLKKAIIRSTRHLTLR